MNLCFITKYPPIQGGVSVQCYWAARGLAERGHVVRVITNADEVEDVFKIDLSSHDKAEGGPYQPRFLETGGRVDVDSTDKPDRSKIYYIPLGNPTISRLVSRGLKAVHEGSCEVIFSQYLEPYGLAASIVGAWTGTPFVFKHAGSDLFRLMDVPDLQPCYRQVLSHAHRVITGGPAQQIVRSHGVSEKQLVSGFGFGLPKVAFNPSTPPADLNGMLASARARWAPPDELGPLLTSLEPSLPVLGIYGKLGEQKGTFDLLHAVRLLINQGFVFHLMVLGRGWQEAEFGRQIVDLGLGRYVRVHPFIPHWQIPSFIRACDAVAFLERDFAIRAHTPTIPSEVLSCGTCLVISEEVLRKQMFRVSARQGKNLVVVTDPRDHAKLAGAIRFALEDSDRARRIGRAGHGLTEELPDIAGYIDGLERILESVIGEPIRRPVRATMPDASVQDERIDPVAVVERLYPYTAALLGASRIQTARTAMSGSMIGSEPIAPREFAIAVGESLLATLSSLAPGHVPDMCRYELMMHHWAGERDRAEEPAGVMAAFDWADFTLARISLRGEVAIEAFEYDVEELALSITRGESLPADPESRFRAENCVLVLFHRGSFPQRVSHATAALLALLRDGALTGHEIHSRLSAALSVELHDIAAEDLADIFQGLFWEGIVAVETARRLPEENSQGDFQQGYVA